MVVSHSNFILVGAQSAGNAEIQSNYHRTKHDTQLFTAQHQDKEINVLEQTSEYFFSDFSKRLVTAGTGK